MPPAALPVPTFDQNGLDITPGAFLKILQDLSTKFASPTDEPISWEFVRERFTAITHYFLTGFAQPHEFSWKNQHERIKLTEITFALIPLVTQQTPEIFFKADDLGKSLVLRILSVCHTLDIWLDVPNIPYEDNYPLPSVLRTKAVCAVVAVLQCLGNSTKQLESEVKVPAGWETLRSLLMECIKGCEGAC